MREELEDLKASPGGADVFDDYRQRAHRGLAIIVGWLNSHPTFADGTLTDPVHLLALALEASDGKRHPIVSPRETKAKGGRPRLDATVQRVLVQNVLVAIRILEAAGRDLKAAYDLMAVELAHANLAVAAKTIESWDAQAGSQTSMGRAVAVVMTRLSADVGDQWPPSALQAEARAKEIARSDHLKFLTWGMMLKT